MYTNLEQKEELEGSLRSPLHSNFAKISPSVKLMLLQKYPDAIVVGNLLIFDKKLSEAEIQEVTRYLSHCIEASTLN